MNAIKKIAVNYFLRKYREPSTWVGVITGMATAAGWALAPDVVNSIAGVLGPVVGLVLVLINEKPKPTADQPTADGVREPAPQPAGDPPAVPHVQAGDGAGVRTPQPEPADPKTGFDAFH